MNAHVAEPLAAAVRTTCPYCGVGCGVIARPDGRAGAAIEGDPEHPSNFGRLCSKGSALGETLGLDGRLLHPMIDGRRASWHAALAVAAEGFTRIADEHGPDAVAFYLSGQLLTEDYYVANKLMKGFIGSGNVDTNSRLCMASSVAGHRRAFGADTVPGCYEDLDEAGLVVSSSARTRLGATRYSSAECSTRARGGGDPLIFGRAGEEIEACAKAGVPVEVVPGISAVQGAAARLAAPLTHRALARRLQVMAGHDHGGALPSDVNWQALADPSATTAIYMPRRTLERLLATGIERGLAPDTPAVAVVNATRPGEQVIRATAATLANAVASSACGGPILVMLGEALLPRREVSAVRGRRTA